LIPLPLPTFIPRYLSPQPPGEWFGHLAFAHDLVAALRPSLLVQIGTGSGDSYFGFCQSIVEQGLDCLCYGVLPPAEDSAQLTAYNDAHYGAFSYLLDSDEASRRFSEGSIDLLHIGIAGYRTDVWLPKVKPGGFVLIDGVADREAGRDTWRRREQLESTFSEQFAFHHGGGLGVLRKPGGTPLTSSLLLSIMSGSAEAREYVRRHYVIYNGYLDRILHIDGATQALNTRIEELTTELQATQHERMFLETEWKQTQFERNDARRSLDHLAAVLAASQTKEIQLQAETRRLAELLQSEREVMQALTNSLSWKVTAPLRAAMEALRTHKKP
jgi:hypothetical protein